MWLVGPETDTAHCRGEAPATLFAGDVLTTPEAPGWDIDLTALFARTERAEPSAAKGPTTSAGAPRMSKAIGRHRAEGYACVMRHTPSWPSARPTRWMTCMMATAALLVGCTDDETTSTKAPSGPSRAEQAPPDFGPVTSPYQFFAASETDLYAVGVRQPVDAAPETIGSILHLDTGETVDIPAPPGLPLLVQGAVTDNSGSLLILGRRCESLIQDENDPDACLPHVVALHLDAQSGMPSWREIDVPAGAGSVAYAQLTQSGPVAVLASNDAAREMLLTFDGDAWHTLATLDSGSNPSKWCATRSDAFHLRITTDPDTLQPLGDGYGDEPVTTYEMERISLSGGALESVHLPNLFPFFGGSAVALSCSETAPVLVSSTGRGGAPTTFTLSDDAWEEPDIGVTADQPASVSSAVSGSAAVFDWTPTPAADGSSGADVGVRRIAAIRADGGHTQVADRAGDALVLYLGATRRVVMVGPQTADEAEGQPAPDPGSDVDLTFADLA